VQPEENNLPTPPKKQKIETKKKKKKTEKATVTIPPAAASWQRKSPICVLFIVASRNLIPKTNRCLLPNEDTNNPLYKYQRPYNQMAPF
jgi:hypothetical protein